MTKDKRSDPKTMDELSDTDKFRALYAKVHQPPLQDDTGKYLVAIVASLVLGIGGVAVIVAVRPDFDILVVAGVIFAFLTPTTTSVLALMKTEDTNKQAKETHLSVNSRLDAFIAQASASARAEGVVEGRDKANERTDSLAETHAHARSAGEKNAS